ncbi:response regulator [Streptomyces sp. bgisy022]|uniref:response regulator n=1 Tax=Streptomyces sp. bgisy022 TaxID=3413769 RepID=UPI003D729946
MPRDARILIVDGHDDTLYALESALAPLGRPLGRATTSEAALKHLLRGNVGLVLLNLRAPGTGGLDVVGYMRRLEQTQHIPVVLLTAHGRDREFGAAAYALGVADVVAKPVDPWTLRIKVRHLYDAHQRRLALERELRDLRARLTPVPAPAAVRPAALPHPHLPPGHPTGAHGELTPDRT